MAAAAPAPARRLLRPTAAAEPLCPVTPALDVVYPGGYKPKGVGGGGALSSFSMSPYSKLWFVGTDMGERRRCRHWAGMHASGSCACCGGLAGAAGGLQHCGGTAACGNHAGAASPLVAAAAACAASAAAARQPAPPCMLPAGHLYRSADAGATWRPVPHSQLVLSSDIEFASPVGFAADNRTLFYASCDNPARTPPGEEPPPCVAKRSTDGGLTWVPMDVNAGGATVPGAPGATPNNRRRGGGGLWRAGRGQGGLPAKQP